MKERYIWLYSKKNVVRTIACDVKVLVLDRFWPRKAPTLL